SASGCLVGGGGTTASAFGGFGASFSATAFGFWSSGFAASGALSLASTMPALIWVNSDCETMSIGTSSIFGASSGRPAGNTTKTHNRIARCNVMEMAALLRTSCPLLRLLLYIGDERDPAKARGADRSHHPHHDAVVHSSVAAHENALVVSILCDSS